MNNTQKYILIALGWLIPALYLTFPIVMVASNLFLLLIVIGFLLTLSKSYLTNEYWPLPTIILVTLFALVILGITYTPASWDWISIHIRKYARFLYAIILILLLIRFPAWQKRALWAFIGALLFILASTWLNVWFVLPWSVTKTPGWGLTHHVFGDYITQNLMMIFLVIFALNQIKKPYITTRSIFWSAIFVLSTISITHLSSGRTGFIALCLALGVYATFLLGIKRFIIITPGIVLIIAAIFSSSTIMRDRFTQGWSELKSMQTEAHTSIGIRTNSYLAVPKLIAEKPIIGHGTGSYHTEICHVLSKDAICSLYSWHPHNQFLFFGAEYGILGLLAYLFLIISLYHCAFKSRNIDAKLLSAGFATILLFNSLFNSPFFSSIESQYFSYIMALMIAMSHRPDLNQSHTNLEQNS